MRPEPSPESSSGLRSDDDDLIRRLRNGDEDAFHAIYLEYYDALSDFARALTGNHTVAEDIVHDAFTRIWERRHSLFLTGALRLYLFKMIRNAASNARRHDLVVQNVEGGMGDESRAIAMGEPFPMADAELEGREFAAQVAAVLAAMPPLRRGALLLRAAQGLSQRQIGEVLGISENAVSVHIARARADLRPLLDRR